MSRSSQPDDRAISQGNRLNWKGIFATLPLLVKGEEVAAPDAHQFRRPGNGIPYKFVTKLRSSLNGRIASRTFLSGNQSEFTDRKGKVEYFNLILNKKQGKNLLEFHIYPQPGFREVFSDFYRGVFPRRWSCWQRFFRYCISWSVGC